MTNKIVRIDEIEKTFSAHKVDTGDIVTRMQTGSFNCRKKEGRAMQKLFNLVVSVSLVITCLLIFNQASFAKDYAPPLGFGYSQKTGKSSVGVAGWIDKAALKDAISHVSNATAMRDESFVENLEQIFKLTRSSAQVKVKSGLFTGEANFSSLSQNSLHNRSIVYLLTAYKEQPFHVSDASATLSAAGNEVVDTIRSQLSKGGEENLTKAQDLYLGLTETMGSTYISQVTRRVYVAVEYRFEAKSEEYLRDIKADLEARYGSYSGEAALEALRRKEVKGINYSARIVAEGADAAALQEINLWAADLKRIQETSLREVRAADMNLAPVASYTAVPLWQAFRLRSKVAEDNTRNWLSIENQRDKFLTDIYIEYLFLSRIKATLDDLSRVVSLEPQWPAIVEELTKRGKSIKKLIKLGKKAMEIDDEEALEAFVDSYNSLPGKDIDYSAILPENRSSLIKVNTFTASVGASAETVYKNNWSGQLYIGFELSTELENLINTITLTRTHGGNSRIIYNGDYKGKWKQNSPTLNTEYRPFGDNQDAAIEYYKQRFRAEDQNAEYKLRLIWIDGHEQIIKLPKWTLE